MPKTIRSRSNMSVLDTFDSKWKIVAKRIVVEPTPRTQFQAPRFGVYDYDLVPQAPPDSPGAGFSAEGLVEKPLISFRKIRS
jgi:hypothetical protein